LTATPAIRQPANTTETGRTAFFWLCVFYLVYCARPEDWIPGLAYIPLAKIAGIAAFLGLAFSFQKLKKASGPLPKEAFYLLAIIVLLFISGALSPVWKGGALSRTLDFAKVSIAWVLTLFLVTNFEKLRRIIFIQAGSVAVIAVVSILKSRGHARLEGILGGIYSNPNDLAFAIVLSLPFCCAFLLTARGGFRKSVWGIAMLMMVVSLFMTASRGGFITLLVAGAVMLWHFGVRGKRFHLILATTLVVVILFATEGDKLVNRFFAISGEYHTGLEKQAYGSYEERKALIILSFKVMGTYPLFGIGVRNFPSYSGYWREVHVTYLQIGAEGGIPVLILYALFFLRGFGNIRKFKRFQGTSAEMKLFAGALHSSLVGFIVGASFAPEAYQYFPYFAVAYTSALLAIAKSHEQVDLPATTANQSWRLREVHVTRELEPSRTGPRLQSPWLSDGEDRTRQR
jgi:O-antigen ligase